MRKILICGSRNWRDEAPIQLFLKNAVNRWGVNGVHVIHGGAPGADTAADRVARKLGITNISREPAQWDLYGKAAGPIRNQLMLDKYKPDEVTAFRTSGKSRGTDDMIARARKAKVPVTVVSD